ncbi:MAG: diphosphomevalonate decarboxylase [Euryarchaeota archaeon]|nr:diphosphomevalonate decarboxylase [Euryarchaeota archaeon]
MNQKTAVAGANIALLKYWGRTDAKLNLPANGSVSLTLDNLLTRTTVEFDPASKGDSLTLDGKAQTGEVLARVTRFLDHVRKRTGRSDAARVASVNAFPAGAGLASSASAFAALAAASFDAAGTKVSAKELSTFARLGSGSASRSVFGGYVEWLPGARHEDSYARQIAAPGHLALHDVACIFSGEKKKVGSLEGHELADRSPIHGTRLKWVNDALPRMKEAILTKDLGSIGDLAERDALFMHSVMMTSDPSVLYWTGETVRGIRDVRSWRDEGIPVWFTIDAGPNLHLLTPAEHAPDVVRRARTTWGLSKEQVIDSAPGEGVRAVEDHLF